MRLALRTAGVAGLIALLGVVAFFVRAPGPTNDLDSPRQAASVEIEPLENVAASAGSSLLARDPFSPARGAFTRQSPTAPVVAPRDVRLVGISTVAGKLRATLMIDGQQALVSEGDSTPVGEVTMLSSDAIEFSGGSASRLELFP